MAPSLESTTCKCISCIDLQCRRKLEDAAKDAVNYIYVMRIVTRLAKITEEMNRIKMKTPHRFIFIHFSTLIDDSSSFIKQQLFLRLFPIPFAVLLVFNFPTHILYSNPELLASFRNILLRISDAELTHLTQDKFREECRLN